MTNPINSYKDQSKTDDQFEKSTSSRSVKQTGLSEHPSQGGYISVLSWKIGAPIETPPPAVRFLEPPPVLSVADLLKDLNCAIENLDVAQALKKIHQLQPQMLEGGGAGQNEREEFHLQVLKLHHLGADLGPRAEKASLFLRGLLNSALFLSTKLNLAEMYLQLAKYGWMSSKNKQYALDDLNLALLCQNDNHPEGSVELLLLRNELEGQISIESLDAEVKKVVQKGTTSLRTMHTLLQAEIVISSHWMKYPTTAEKGVARAQRAYDDFAAPLSKVPMAEKTLKKLLVTLANYYNRKGDPIQTSQFAQAGYVLSKEDVEAHAELVQLLALSKISLFEHKHAIEIVEQGFADMPAANRLKYVRTTVFLCFDALKRLDQWFTMHSLLGKVRKWLDGNQIANREELADELAFFDALISAGMGKVADAKQKLAQLEGFLDRFPIYTLFWEELTQIIVEKSQKGSRKRKL